MNRSLSARSLQTWLVLLALVGSGCNSITVTRSKSAGLLAAWRSSVSRHCRLSPRTEQTLRQLDLIGVYDADPGQAISQLHAIALKEPLPDILFALAEVNHLQARKLESWQPREAIGHYYLCAGYAYHYLFATADRNSDLQVATNKPCRMLTPQNSFDPRFRLACDLYNQSLAKCIDAAQRVGQLDARQQLHLPTPDGKGFTLSVVHHGFRWKPEEFGQVLFCKDFKVQGLDNHHETYGLGVPLIVQRAAVPAWPPGMHYPPSICFPATAFFRFDGGLAELYARRTGQLELYNPMSFQDIQVSNRMVPLQTDLTTPLAYLLSGSDLTFAGYGGFLEPDRLQGLTGLYLLEPYQPDKIPVVLVHGLLSSPLTWAPLFNDLQADPKLRENYQFWFYFYPTANSYLISTADLRKDLAQLRQQVDPQKNNRSFDQMVLVGHSMGGLVSRLLTVDSGDAFWKGVSNQPLDEMPVAPDAKQELQAHAVLQQGPERPARDLPGDAASRLTCQPVSSGPAGLRPGAPAEQPDECGQGTGQGQGVSTSRGWTTASSCSPPSRRSCASWRPARNRTMCVITRSSG